MAAAAMMNIIESRKYGNGVMYGRVMVLDKMRITYCTDLDKSVLVSNFEKRGWSQVGPDDDWNFFWAGTHTCRSLFSVDSGYRMTDNQ